MISGDKTINMKFKVKSPDGVENDVEFDFNVETDTSYGVAEEMVKDLELPKNLIEIISNQMNSLVQKVTQDDNT